VQECLHTKPTVPFQNYTSKIITWILNCLSTWFRGSIPEGEFVLLQSVLHLWTIYLLIESSRSLLVTMAAQVNPQNFNPRNYLVATPLDQNDRAPCICGKWYFYSATCHGVYQVYPVKCGDTRTLRGVDTAYCKGKSSRALVANILVNADCPAAHPHV